MVGARVVRASPETVITAMVDPLLGTGERSLAEVVDGVLFDLDGVVYRGSTAVPHAPESIERLQIPTGYVTNNAGRSPQVVADHLTDLGITTRPEQVTTSAQAAAGLIAQRYGTGTKVLMVGGPGLQEAILENGLTLVASAEDAPDVVVQGTSQTITWPDLAEAVYAINAGAVHIATNLDSTMPTDRGIALGNGALVKAISHATGRTPAAAAGKPDPQIFAHAAALAKMRRPVVVGDRMDTDIAGAVAAGMPGLLVFTGVATAQDVLRSQPQHRPTYLARDLRGLHETHPEVESAGGRFQCAEATAWLEGGELLVSSGGAQKNLSGVAGEVNVSLNELRAACGAAWATQTELELLPTIHIRG